MDRKKTTMVAILPTAILVTILTTTSPAPALALGHWNEGEDNIHDGELAIGGVPSPDTPFSFPNLLPEVGEDSQASEQSSIQYKEGLDNYKQEVSDYMDTISTHLLQNKLGQ